MEYLVDGDWQFIWHPSQILPPQWEATIIIKGTFALKRGEKAEKHDQAESITGPTFDDDDPERSLLYLKILHRPSPVRIF